MAERLRRHARRREPPADPQGGIAEGTGGFQVRRSFFGLLPTLFHQAKVAADHAKATDVAPPAPSTVDLVCQLVETYVVPSDADLAMLAPYHRYALEQLAARQQYKPERPLNLILVRAFALRAPVTIDTARVRPVCKSWAEIDLAAGLGGIDPVAPIDRSNAALDAARRVIQALPAVQLINAAPD